MNNSQAIRHVCQTGIHPEEKVMMPRHEGLYRQDIRFARSDLSEVGNDCERSLCYKKANGNMEFYLVLYGPASENPCRIAFKRLTSPQFGI